jgi:hypothetical protein
MCEEHWVQTNHQPQSRYDEGNNVRNIGRWEADEYDIKLGHKPVLDGQ